MPQAAQQGVILLFHIISRDVPPKGTWLRISILNKGKSERKKEGKKSQLRVGFEPTTLQASDRLASALSAVFQQLPRSLKLHSELKCDFFSFLIYLRARQSIDKPGNRLARGKIISNLIRSNPTLGS